MYLIIFYHIIIMGATSRRQAYSNAVCHIVVGQKGRIIFTAEESLKRRKRVKWEKIQ